MSEEHTKTVISKETQQPNKDGKKKKNKKAKKDEKNKVIQDNKISSSTNPTQNEELKKVNQKNDDLVHTKSKSMSKKVKKDVDNNSTKESKSSFKKSPKASLVKTPKKSKELIVPVIKKCEDPLEAKINENTSINDIGVSSDKSKNCTSDYSIQKPGHKKEKENMINNNDKHINENVDSSNDSISEFVLNEKQDILNSSKVSPVVLSVHSDIINTYSPSISPSLQSRSLSPSLSPRKKILYTTDMLLNPSLFVSSQPQIIQEQTTMVLDKSIDSNVHITESTSIYNTRKKLPSVHNNQDDIQYVKLSIPELPDFVPFPDSSEINSVNTLNNENNTNNYIYTKTQYMNSISDVKRAYQEMMSAIYEYNKCIDSFYQNKSHIFSSDSPNIHYSQSLSPMSFQYEETPLSPSSTARRTRSISVDNIIKQKASSITHDISTTNDHQDTTTTSILNNQNYSKEQESSSDVDTIPDTTISISSTNGDSSKKTKRKNNENFKSKKNQNYILGSLYNPPPPSKIPIPTMIKTILQKDIH
ncbi:hypothetical protein WA158_000989 [Blastocystis sp. Blastoise]